jgi:hypothetical protein
MTPDLAPKLTQEHCDQLCAVIQQTAVALDYCTKCEAAGLDMSGYRETLEAQRKVAEGVKRVFFPDRN